MAIVSNGGTTNDPTLTVRVGLTGTGAVAGDSVKIYNGLAQIGGSTALTATDISNGYADVNTPSLANASYSFSAALTHNGATSTPAPAYVVTVAGGGGGGGSGATLLFEDHFTSLELASAGSPNKFWRPNAFWQNLAKGYEDFAGNSWNINPNDTNPAYAAYNPFSISGSILTIKAFRTPAGLVSTIRADMDSQQQFNAVPAWCGGILIQNPLAPAPAQKWKYGYFEKLMRCPIQGKGMFPALWFYATDGGGDPLGKGSAEIDMLEIFGTPNQWSTTLHPGSTLGTESNDTAGWHTYGMDWQPSYLRFYKDDALIYDVTGSEATYFNTTMGVLMNYSMDAPWFGGGVMSDGSTPSPLTMEIDYVRVYNIKP